MARSSRRRPLARLLSAPALAIALLLTSLTVQAQSEPTPAQNLRAEVLPGGGIVLSWDAPADDAESITGYEILRRRPNRGENTLLSYVGDTRSNATTYTDLDAREPGEQYVYRVVALRGSSRSGRSNFARVVMPDPIPAGPDPVDPDPADLAPANLAVHVAARGADLSWDAPAADAATVTGYRVLRSVGQSAMTILADTGSDDTTYTDASAATPGETYAYMVQALRGAEASQGSNTVSVSAPQAPDVPRSAASRVADATAPGNLTVTIVADGIALSWDAPMEGAHFLRGYQILRSRAGAPFTIRKASTHSRGTSYVDSWADWPGMTYTYQVKALRGRNVSEGSNQASLTRPACDGGSFNVTPEDVPVTAVPIVVTSTTQDYFVLFVRPILETDLEVPISVTLGESGSTTLQDRLEPLPAAHYRIEKYPVNDPADVDGDCTSDIDELNDLGTKNPLNRATPIVRHNGTVAIPDRETFERLSYQGTDLTFDIHLTELEFVKFFIYDERADRAGVYFMNTNTHRSHNGFFRVVEFPFRHSMRGVLVFHPNAIAPDGSLGVYRFEFEPWDTYSFTDVHHAYELLAASMPLLENNLSYYPVPEVLPLYYEEQLQYDASRVSLLFDNDIFPDVSFVQLNQGVGFGLLRSLSLEERPNPRDIVIYESLPNDLPRVAGIITTVPQTPLSHVNLRALQDRAPNAFIRDALDDDTIDSLIGSLVRYTVLRDSYTIRAASKSELDAHYEASRPAAAQAPVRDLTVTAITALSGVAFGDWDAFGVKAANVAVLGTLGFADGTVPDGFAVPFYFYDEFMKANELDAMVTTMLADADFQASYDTQEKELKKLRKAIKDATTPAWMITALEEMHAGFPEGTSLRYRSSTNNEDLPGFSGAGLYDSKTQDPDETEEDGIDKSIKGVWASLWNFRAFVERDFNRIDHSATAMGVLVHPNYSDELANGVAVSYDPPTNRTGAYYVNTQVGEDLVTNPEALSAPEQLLLLSDGSYEVIVRSNQVESNELLMTDAQIAQLRGHLATIHSSFKTLYAPAAGERFAMEIEFKITSDNVLAIKQARPWVFRPLNEPAAFPNTETGERTIAEGTPSNVAIGDPVAATDPDDDALTYTLSGADADWFRVDSSSGQLLTEKLLDFETQDRHEVDITVGDPFNAATTTIMVTINVTDVDEPADITFTEGSNVTANDNALTVDENHNGRLATFTASDPEGAAGLTYQWALEGTDHSHFAITAAGELSFLNIPDYDRPAGGKNVYNITVKATDSAPTPLTGRITVTVAVLPVNEPPVISGPDEVSIAENGADLVGTYRAMDPDANTTIVWRPLEGADKDEFTFTSSNGRLTFKETPDFEDAARFGNNVYAVTLGISGGGDTARFDVEVTVTNEEEPGKLSLPSTRPQAEAEYTATLSDPDGVVSTTWTWERSMRRSGSSWAPVSGAVNNTTTTSVYTPGTDDVGYYLRATAAYTDALGDKSPVAVSTNSVLAAPVSNTPPVFTETNPTRSVAENARANARVGDPVTATDPDPGNTVRYEFEPLESDLFTIDASTGQIRVKTEGALDYETQPMPTVTVKALDGSNASATIEVTIEVTNVNEPPDAVADAPDSFDEDTSIEIRVLDNDSDPEDERSELLLTVFNSGLNAPRNGTVSVNEPASPGENRTITYKPNDDYNGSDSFTYRVRDTGSPSLSSTASVSVQIDAVNDAPTFSESMPARRVSESAEHRDEVGLPVDAEDVEGDTLTYSLSGADASSFEIDSYGQITVASGTTFDIGMQDTYEVTVEAVDENFETATVDVTITVVAGPVVPPPSGGGGGGFAGGGGGGGGPSPSVAEFEWNVTRDIEDLDSAHDKPSGHWSDGATLWVLENGDGSDDAVYAYDIETGERVEGREFALDDTNRAPRGVWSDRTVIWVSDSGRNSLFAHDLEAGERLPERDIALAARNRAARGIWSADETMWVLDGGKDSLFAYDLASGELLAEYELASANGDPHGIWSDGVSLWVSDHDAKRLFAYRLPVPDAEEVDGEDLELERVRDEEFPNTILSRASNNSPRGLWSDGDVMYVVDASDGKVYTYNMPDAIDARLSSLTLSGVEFGEFSPNQEEYEGAADDGVTVTTVEAAAAQDDAVIVIDPPDADEAAEGRQVAVGGGAEITVTVTSADGSRTKTYRVAVADAGPSASCLRGAIDEGFSLVVSEGGSIEDLVACAESRNVTALYTLDGGEYVSYILGAPEPVNEGFVALYADGVPALTPLIAKSEGPPSPAPASDDVREFGPDCLRGEIVEGFSLVLSGGGSVDDLEACADEVGFAAVYVLADGVWVSYILGAPEMVNATFRELFADGVPSIAPLVARSDGPRSGPVSGR